MLRPEEALAKRAIEHIHRDVALEFECDQSSSRADFRMRWKDGRTGCLEVTAAVNCPVRETNHVIEQSTRKTGWLVRDHRLNSAWLIDVESSAQIERLREFIAATLVELEGRGLKEFSAYRGPIEDGLRATLASLRVLHAQQIGWKEPGEVWISSIGGSGWVGIGQVNDAVEEEARKPDNLRKLSLGDVDERHLCVAIVDCEHHAWSSVLAATEPGSELSAPKDVDPAIDRIWCVAERGDLTVLLSWTKGANSWLVHSIDPREVAVQDGV